MLHETIHRFCYNITTIYYVSEGLYIIQNIIMLYMHSLFAIFFNLRQVVNITKICTNQLTIIIDKVLQ